MAYTIAQNDVIQIRTRATLFGQTVRSIFTYRCDTASTLNGGIQALVDFLTAFKGVAGVYSVMRAAQGVSIQYNQLVAQVVYPTRRALVQQQVADTGTNASDTNTANIAAVIGKFTDLATPRKLKAGTGGTALLHLPAIPANALIAGNLSNGYVGGALVGLALAMSFALTAADGCKVVPCIWHRNAANTHTTDITNITPNTTTRTMRRRTLGVGE